MSKRVNNNVLTSLFGGWHEALPIIFLIAKVWITF